jgi:hypothetical protein
LILEGYRAFITARKPMAAFVAADLAEWQYWDAVPAYIALLKSGGVRDAESRQAIIDYLTRSPRADAKKAVTSLPVASGNPR